MKKLILVLVLAGGLLVRMYKIDAPLADWHSWRQADTAAVARNFIKHGYHLLHPTFDDLSSIPSGKQNPHGWRFVEFPLYNAAHALFFQLLQALGLKFISFEMAGRLTSIIASLFSGWFLYLIAKEYYGELTGILALFFFLFLPYNIYYSRTILPGPTMLSFSLASLYFLILEERKSGLEKKLLWSVSLFLAAISVLVKPYAVFILLPSWLVIFGKRLFQPSKKFKSSLTKILIYCSFSALPFLAWRWWMKNFPEGIPANTWLLNSGNIRFRPAWWRWIFAERLGKLILGYWGGFLLTLGIATRKKLARELLFYSWIFGALGYLVVFARGNIQHDYYQIVIMPTVAISLAKGGEVLIRNTHNFFYPCLNLIIFLITCTFMFSFSWYQVRGYYQINHPEIIEAGRTADRLLPPDAKVIAPYNGDTAFLYQVNRPGWPAVTASLEKMRSWGATHYVSVNFDTTTKWVADHCSILAKNNRWLIADLRKCKP